MGRKILILGAASYQLPLINEARKRGYHVTVCTNNEKDPGIKLADEFYLISIANHEAVIELAKKIKPDRVVGYVSETSMQAERVINKALGLSAVSEEAMKTLSRKDYFRNFQSTNGFPHPRYFVVSKKDTITTKDFECTYPVIVKPVDSCGSRGVSRIDGIEELEAALEYAWYHSANDLALVEEVISAQNRQFTGDGFMVDRQLKFLCYGEHLFDSHISKVTACGSLWPARVSKSLTDEIYASVSQQLTAIGYENGPFNIDFRINEEGKTVIIEISPRNGANYFPQLINFCTGVDLVSALFDKFEGITPCFKTTESNYAISLILYSGKDGILDSVSIASSLNKWVLQKDISTKVGDQVSKYQHLGHSLGVLNLGFNTLSTATDVIENRARLVNIRLKDA